jgi:hypothetical protein
VVAETTVGDCEREGDGVRDEWDGGDGEWGGDVGVGGSRGTEELFNAVGCENAAGVAGVSG